MGYCEYTVALLEQQIESIRIFVKVIQNGSYTRAASLLHLPKSSVSRAVSRLEKESGTKLLLRTTRSLSLTAAGRAFYDSCIAPLQQLEDARKSLFGSDSLLQGPLKITAPEDLGLSIVTPTLAQLSKQHAGLHFEIFYSDQTLDLIKEGFDLAIRIGNLKDSQLKSQKLGEIQLILVASKKFLQKAKVKSIDDLAAFPCLSYAPRYQKTRWQLRSSRGTRVLNFDSKLVCNQMSSLLSFALADSGIALLPHYLCKKEIENGRLIHILPEYHEAGYPVWLVSPHSIQSSARVKVVAQTLQSEIKKLLK